MVDDDRPSGRSMTRALPMALVAGFVALFASEAYAYVGPGAGLSAFGSLLAVFAAVVVAIFGFVWLPVKRLMRKRKQANAAATTTGTPPATGAATRTATATGKENSAE